MYTEEKIKEYAEIVGRNYQRVDLLQTLAQVYLIKREYKKAIIYFECFIYSKNTPHYFFLIYAMALKNVGCSKEAFKWMSKYISYFRDDIEDHPLLQTVNWQH